MNHDNIRNTASSGDHRQDADATFSPAGKMLLVALAAVLLLPAGCGKKETSTIPLVQNGRAASAIVLPENSPDYLREIAEDFAGIVERSTGAALPVISESEEPALAPGMTRIFLGDTQKAKEAGFSSGAPPEEGYHLLARPGEIFILGRDDQGTKSADARSRPTRWALNRLLEEGLGVRWLWPGRLGTYVPAARSFSVAEADITYQPGLSIRRLRLNPREWPLSADPALDAILRKEAAEWAENHQSGRREGPVFGHAFGHWWGKYGKDHPDYFAETPPNEPQPRADRVKLRLANPAVIERIASEYEAAGAPRYWNVCPNDGYGFDLSAETRAWDIPPDLDPQAIWKGTANLTPRFVKFWNLLSERLRQINPDVILCTYAYASYREPPPPERPLTAPSALMVVCGYHDFQMWTDWSSQPGVRSVFLRPNWGHLAAHAPHLPLRETHQFLEFCWENKMEGFDNDALIGFWATQGPLYYLWARMLARPDLSLDAILDEYTSAFGAAAPLIRQYLDYWQKVTSEIAIVDPYAYETSTSAKGRFAALLKEGKTETNFVRGSRRALPYLYGDDVIAPARALLDQALVKLGDKDAEARERVLFLKSGLDELRMSRDLYALAAKINKRSPEDLQKLQEASDAVVKFREQLTPTHAIWGNRVTGYEDHYKVQVRPANIATPQPRLEGL